MTALYLVFLANLIRKAVITPVFRHEGRQVTTAQCHRATMWQSWDKTWPFSLQSTLQPTALPAPMCLTWCLVCSKCSINVTSYSSWRLPIQGCPSSESSSALVRDFPAVRPSQSHSCSKFPVCLLVKSQSGTTLAGRLAFPVISPAAQSLWATQI